MNEFKVTGSSEGDLLRLELLGELVYETSTKAREQIRPFFEKIPEGGRCLFNTNLVSRIDSTGFGVLIHFVRLAVGMKVRVAVSAPDPFIMDLFRIAKFDRVMSVSCSEDAALKALESTTAPVLSPLEY